MAKKNQEPVQMRLGNPEAAKISTIMYSYLFPFFFGATAIVLLFSKAWLTSLIFAVLCIITLPQTKEFLAKFKIKGLIKLAVCLVLLYLAFLSSSLYI